MNRSVFGPALAASEIGVQTAHLSEPEDAVDVGGIPEAIESVESQPVLRLGQGIPGPLSLIRHSRSPATPVEAVWTGKTTARSVSTSRCGGVGAGG